MSGSHSFDDLDECCRKDLGLPPDERIVWYNVDRFPSLPGIWFYWIFCGPRCLERAGRGLGSSAFVAVWLGVELDRPYQVVELRRDGVALREILRERWEFLWRAYPKQLAYLILDVMDDNVRGHSVLDSTDALLKFPLNSEYKGFRDQYKIDPTVLDLVRKRLGRTRMVWHGDSLNLRAITLSGRDHLKTNLGIETIAVRQDGEFTIRPRQVWSDRVFAQMPQVLWD